MTRVMETPEGLVDLRGLNEQEREAIIVLVMGLLEKKMLLEQRESEAHSDR